MGKPIEARISYYTRKVVEHFSTHVTKRRNRYRHDRLMAYKKAMHKRFEGR